MAAEALRADNPCLAMQAGLGTIHVIQTSFALFKAVSSKPSVGHHSLIEQTRHTCRRFSIPGVITIVHLLSWAGLCLTSSALADAGGVINVDASNRLAVTVLNWCGFLLACPLYTLVAPRGFNVVWLDVVGMVANSLLVGFGMAGAIRIVIRRQFGLRFMFVLTTLAAICLYRMTYLNDTRTFLILVAATVALGALSLAYLRRAENAGQ